ncbi:hypothetical protein [Cytobacillus oceanisediminis]|uniref:hypothetical protein n=1 Tax=Cytobacillus oceanisediminis TaxID=665099 RepID=UPI001FB4739B|nr:hypothetical protein [Cytobacillus oceanisediminis]UOE58109.1 hypothetical protein IRB79_26740 [Cytobacillus oceanisediminis]
MSKAYNQFQNDVTNTASQLMTQLMCAERGIDYNTLLTSAHQAHLQGILAQEQARQVNQIVSRHYNQNSGSLIGRLKEAISPTPSVNVGFPGAPMPMSPMGMTAMNQVAAPQPFANVVNPPVQYYQAPVQQQVPYTEEHSRIGLIERDMNDLKMMIAGLANSLQSQPLQQQAPQQAPQFAQAGYQQQS